jgi:hypothetical protein
MLIFLATLLSTLHSIFRSRAVLELENLALRHQRGASAIREKTVEIEVRRSFTVGLSVLPLAKLAFGARHRQARNRRGLASRRLSPVDDKSENEATQCFCIN